VCFSTSKQRASHSLFECRRLVDAIILASRLVAAVSRAFTRLSLSLSLSLSATTSVIRHGVIDVAAFPFLNGDSWR